MIPQNLPNNTHFWAKMGRELVMMLKDAEGEYYVCGGWECPIRETEFEVLQVVPMPDGWEAKDLYYQ